MQIVARVMKTFRVNVPLHRFYESPTIAGLSAIVATHARVEEIRVKIHRSGTDLQVTFPSFLFSRATLVHGTMGTGNADL